MFGSGSSQGKKKPQGGRGSNQYVRRGSSTYEQESQIQYVNQARGIGVPSPSSYDAYATQEDNTYSEAYEAMSQSPMDPQEFRNTEVKRQRANAHLIQSIGL